MCSADHCGANIVIMSRVNDHKIKVCFAASSGGHYEQLLMLRPLMYKYDSFILTESTKYRACLDGERTYYLWQANRREWTAPARMIVNVVMSIYIFIKERPDVVVCTGVLSMIPMCLVAKLFRRRLIYIESFAKINSATETGKLLYHCADQFYVQWESMLDIYPKAIYRGGIY